MIAVVVIVIDSTRRWLAARGPCSGAVQSSSAVS
jgi:hypothetical protein